MVLDKRRIWTPEIISPNLKDWYCWTFELCDI